jgi:3-methyladenine DNA glycosylase AlkD
MDVDLLTRTAADLLSEQADEAKAEQMAAYMKTAMPFYGVQAPAVRIITRQVVKQFPPDDIGQYDRAVRALWGQKHREEKYLAISYARRFHQFISTESLDLYRMMIVDGAWWDFVDTIAAHLVGRVLVNERDATEPRIRSWINDGDMWLRRTSIICQLPHKAETDTALLSDACLTNAADKEFFIRKAIGWALREYAKTDPEWVREFVDTHRGVLSGLSIREATKHL